MVTNARIRAQRIDIKPIGGFPQNNNESFPVMVRHMAPCAEGQSIWDCDETKRQKMSITEFEAIKLDNTDMYGSDIDWVPMRDGWYTFLETYGPLLITEAQFHEMGGKLDEPPKSHQHHHQEFLCVVESM